MIESSGGGEGGGTEAVRDARLVHWSIRSELSTHTFICLGFGVWGVGFGVWGLGLGVWGSWFEAEGAGFRVQVVDHDLDLLSVQSLGLGFRV